MREQNGVVAAVTLSVALLPAGAAGGNAEVLPRSVYVPVRLEAASCLREVVVRTEDGQVRSPVPGRIVVQFTFFERRDGAEPPWERLRI